MGRISLLVLLVTNVSFALPTHYLLIPEWSAPIAKLLQPEEMVFLEQDASLVKVSEARVDEFSLAIHKELKACGGFMDVTHRIQSGESPTGVVLSHLIMKRAPQRRIDFGPTLARNAIQDLVNKADDNELWAFLTKLSSFDDRSATSDLGTEAANFLAATAKTTAGELPGFSVRKVVTSSYPKQPSVVATLPGLKPALPRVVIGGHMDTFTSGKPGADDDGSGTAVVMEALRVVAKAAARFDHTVDFVWYAAEERGLVGSQYVVKDYKNNGLQVKAVMQFDMTGWKDPNDEEDVYLITDYTNNSLTQKLREIIQTYTTARVGETECGYACSDHASWTSGGFPAVFPFESSFDNMNYRLHTSDDKIIYLDKLHAGNFARIALAFLGEMAVLKENQTTKK